MLLEEFVNKKNTELYEIKTKNIDLESQINILKNININLENNYNLLN